MSERRGLPFGVKVSLVAAVIVVDLLLLIPVAKLMFGQPVADTVLPPVAGDPPVVVSMLEAAPRPDVQLLLKPVRDPLKPDQGSMDPNRFNDDQMNQRILGLREARYRFFNLIVVNFSADRPVSVDLAARPLEVTLSVGGESIRALTAADLEAAAGGKSMTGAARSTLRALGRGPGRLDVPPRSLGTILVALPADRLDSRGEMDLPRIESAVLRGGLGIGGASDTDVTLEPAIVRKEALDDFLLSPREPLPVLRDGVRLSLRETSSSAGRETEYGPR